MKVLQKAAASLAAFSIILIVLVTAAEAAIYSDYGFYQKEYEKYEVLDDLDMEMEDVMQVTGDMMKYLHGYRENLVVHTTVAGEEREFFNKREKAHMVDVEKLFKGAVNIRYAAVGIFVIVVLALIFTKADLRRLLLKCYMVEMAGFLLTAGGIGCLFAMDFNRYFVKFHEIFFDNDLWLLDPETDLMIRMLPEGFFADFLARIAVFAGAAIAVTFAISAIVYRMGKRK